MKSRQSSKQEISTYRAKGFLEINRDQSSFYLIFFRVIQNILDRSYSVTNSSIFHICTLVMMDNAGQNSLKYFSNGF